MTTAQGPLAGLKVLDLSIIVAGGTASSLLADFGAEVIKVERPGAGDPLRNWGPFANGVSLWWKVHSRNKKSITLKESLLFCILNLNNNGKKYMLMQQSGFSYHSTQITKTLRIRCFTGNEQRVYL